MFDVVSGSVAETTNQEKRTSARNRLAWDMPFQNCRSLFIFPGHFLSPKHPPKKRDTLAMA